MDNLTNKMKDQVFSLPNLIRAQYEDLEPKIRKTMTTPQIFSFQRIIITGSGDSYAAGLAMKSTFEKLTRLPVEIVSTIDLARFLETSQLGFAPNNPLVLAVSNSGDGARIGEAAQRALKHGSFVLGITGKPRSVLGKNSSAVIQLDIPSFPSSPGIRSYIVSLMTLLLVAIRIGEVRGRYTMDHAMALRKDIVDQAVAFEKELPTIDKKMNELAEQWKDIEAWDFVGAGSDYATAWYGQAKVLEATGQYAMHINSEEWLHLNFFLRKTHSIGTVVVASTTNAALSRTKEMLGYARILQRPLLVVTDANWEDFDFSGFHVVHFVPSAFVDSISLTQSTPISLLVGYMMALIGEVDGRGATGLWSFCKDGAAVKNSEIIII
jgi:glucosamine 6-phosphate synthetase-like amidotransferase/phosphosugar isomerase protein